MTFRRTKWSIKSQRGVCSLLVIGIFTGGFLNGVLHAQSSLTAPQLPPNPQMESLVDDIRKGWAFMIDEEETVNLMVQYVLKRYVEDNCNTNCTQPCKDLGGWLWQNPEVTCRDFR